MTEPSNALNNENLVGTRTDSLSVRSKKPVKSADIPGFFHPLAGRLHELVNSAVDAMPPPILEKDEPPQTLPRLHIESPEMRLRWKTDEDGVLTLTWKRSEC
jgi:hypothetical protein